MELEGTIIFDLPLQEGVSKAGRPWKKKEWVLETPGMYPRRVKFHVFGDRVDMLNFEVGKSYAVTFELESREFNGRWYTDIRCWRADVETPAAAAPAQPTAAPGAVPPPPLPDDIPF